MLGFAGSLHITQLRRKSVRLAGISQICTESPAQLTVGKDQPVAHIMTVTQLHYLNKNLGQYCRDPVLSVSGYYRMRSYPIGSI